MLKALGSTEEAPELKLKAIRCTRKIIVDLFNSRKQKQWEAVKELSDAVCY